MAVYRSDQAQLSFGTETSPGAYAELASGALGGAGATASLTADVAAGATQLSVDGFSTGTGADISSVSSYMCFSGEGDVRRYNYYYRL